MIIFVDDIRAIRPIAENINDSKRLIPYIDECEQLYLRKSIDVRLYLDIERYRSNYDLLFDGGLYDNSTKSFPGLKKAMGYLVYSRFVRNQNVNVTAFGIVSKNGDFSEKVDDRTIVRIANDAEKIGLEYLSQCVDYLKFEHKVSNKTTAIKKNKFRAIGD